MKNTYEMLKTLLIGNEKELSEKEVILQYQEKLSPNILAYFYCNNFGMISMVSRLYPLLSDEDKASFCLQELDKCLQDFDTSRELKFMTYFIKCYKNRLRNECGFLFSLSKKAMVNYMEIPDDENSFDNYIDMDCNNVDLILSNYNLTELEKTQCKLLNIGYTIKDIAKMSGISPMAIYKRFRKIKQKILI